MSQIKMFAYGSLREGFFNYDKYLKGNIICLIKDIQLF